MEDGSPSVAGSADACSAFEKEEEEDIQELVEQGAELTDDEIGTKEHQDDDDAGCGGGRELGGGGSSSTVGGDGDRDGIQGLRSLWEKISLAVRLGSGYRTPGMFWNYTTHIFGLSRRG